MLLVLELRTYSPRNKNYIYILLMQPKFCSLCAYNIESVLCGCNLIQYYRFHAIMQFEFMLRCLIAGGIHYITAQDSKYNQNTVITSAITHGNDLSLLYPPTILLLPRHAPLSATSKISTHLMNSPLNAVYPPMENIWFT